MMGFSSLKHLLIKWLYQQLDQFQFQSTISKKVALWMNKSLSV